MGLGVEGIPGCEYDAGCSRGYAGEDEWELGCHRLELCSNEGGGAGEARAAPGCTRVMLEVTTPPFASETMSACVCIAAAQSTVSVYLVGSGARARARDEAGAGAGAGG